MLNVVSDFFIYKLYNIIMDTVYPNFFVEEDHQSPL